MNVPNHFLKNLFLIFSDNNSSIFRYWLKHDDSSLWISRLLLFSPSNVDSTNVDLNQILPISDNILYDLYDDPDDEKYQHDNEQLIIKFKNKIYLINELLTQLKIVVDRYNYLSATQTYDGCKNFINFRHTHFIDTWISNNSSFAFLIGGAFYMDRFIETKPKWKSKWANIQYENLSETAKTYINNHGRNVVWPPNVQRRTTPTSNSWLYSATFRKKHSDKLIKNLTQSDVLQRQTPQLMPNLSNPSTVSKFETKNILKNFQTFENQNKHLSHKFVTIFNISDEPTNSIDKFILKNINPPLASLLMSGHKNTANLFKLSTDQYSILKNKTRGFIQLLKHDDYVLYGSRQGASFILQQWGFLRLTVNKSCNLNWASSVLFNGNAIKRVNTAHKFILNKYASNLNYNLNAANSFNEAKFKLNSSLLVKYSNFNSTLHKLTNSAANTIINTGISEFANVHSPAISSFFGIQNMNPHWSLLELRMFKNRFTHNLNKIKFKNHQFKLWVRLRNEFAKIVGAKFRFQHQLTKFLPKFYRKRGMAILKSYEFSLPTVLVRARFALNFDIANQFISANWVFVNFYQIKYTHFQIYQYDVIQMPVSSKYFILFRWLYSDMLKAKSRLLSRIILIAKVRTSIKKKLPKYPDWILKYSHIDEDIPSYLEVDFLSMSILMLTYPIHAHEFDQFSLYNLNIYSPKMLNWKYIT